MEHNNIEDISELPVKATISILRPSKYGRVPGLEDDELADPEELERLGAFSLFRPLLTFGWGDRRWEAEAKRWLNGERL